MKIETRRASTEDIEIISKLADIAFRHTYRDILSSDQIDYMMDWMYSEVSLRAQMTERANVFFIMSADGRDIGYASFERHTNPPADLEGRIVFNLQKLYVLPEYQRCSCGSRLLELVEERMRFFVGVSPATHELNVNRRNPAVGFYRKHGLAVNREGDFPIGNGYYMNDYIMRKDL